jgi:hypothetical protein
MKVDLRLVSPMEKVFLDGDPRGGYGAASALKGETASFQAAWRVQEPQGRYYGKLRVTGDVPLRVRCVRSVPVAFPTMPDADDDYLRKTPGLYPDVLDEILPGDTLMCSWRWECVWIDIEGAPAGDHEVTVELEDNKGGCLAREEFRLHVVNAALPEQELIHTKWLHCDCLCQYYGVEMWSERFWEICENFVRAAVRRGINMLLTPIHTPPLDTAVGGERMTCQLVDVRVSNSGYTFGFERFERWVDMARRCGVKYFEMAHLFTQWGARHAPKIMADVDGVETQIFGWDTEATGDLYIDFLRSYLEALTAELEKLGLDKCTYFHISDEPSVEMLDDYRAARDYAMHDLGDYPVIDALSNYEFYTSGAVKKPIPAVNHIEPFIEGGLPGLWAYYCISQYKDVSNTFIAMPGQRTRILGVQLYKFDIEGFLQWGYNFYNSQYSTHPVNPWITTDGDGFSPAGDTFQVYPGADGKPVESLRMMLADEAISDLRALKLLESLTDKKFVMSIVEDGIAPITFSEYPRDAEYLIGLRRRVNAEIEKRIG